MRNLKNKKSIQNTKSFLLVLTFLTQSLTANAELTYSYEPINSRSVETDSMVCFQDLGDRILENGLLARELNEQAHQERLRNNNPTARHLSAQAISLTMENLNLNRQRNSWAYSEDLGLEASQKCYKTTP